MPDNSQQRESTSPVNSGVSANSNSKDVEMEKGKEPDSASVSSTEPAEAIEDEKHLDPKEPSSDKVLSTTEPAIDQIQKEQRDVERAASEQPPMHSVFSHRKRIFIVTMAGLGAFFSPVSTSIYFPALDALSQDLHVSSGLINLSLTTFMIFQGLAPSFMLVISVF